MVTYATTYGSPDAVLALGDNFYTKGVASPTDSMYTTHFSKLYRSDASMATVPWYTVPGNHDYGYGWNTMSYAQGPARGKVDPYWKTKGTNYTEIFDIPGGGQLAVVFADTTTLSPQTNKYTNENGGISTDTQYARIHDQMTRLVSYYEAAQGSEWILTAGHYPIFSRGDHSDNSYLQQLLLPLIESYGSQMYMCGHDHINMHLQHNNIEYLIAGASAMNDQVKSTSDANMLWAGESYSAFVVMKVWRDKISYDYINNDNEVVYSYSQTNAHTQPIVQSDEPSAPPTAPPRAESPDTRKQESSSSSRSRVLIVVGSVGSLLSLAALGIYIRCGGGGKASRSKSSRSRSRLTRLSQATLSTHGSTRGSGKPGAGDRDRNQHALSALLVNVNAAQAQSDDRPEESSERGRYDDSDDAGDIEGNLVPRVFCDPGPGSLAAPPRNEQPLAKIRREVLSPVVDAALGRAALSPTGPGTEPFFLSAKAGAHRATKSTPF